MRTPSLKAGKDKRKILDKHRNNIRINKTWQGEDEYGQFVNTHKKYVHNDKQIVRFFYGQIITYIQKIYMGDNAPAIRYEIINMINRLIGDKNATLKIKSNRLYLSELVPVVDIWLHEHSSVIPVNRISVFQDKKHSAKLVRSIPYSPNKSIGSNEQDGLLLYQKSGIPLFVIRVHYQQHRKNTKIIYAKKSYSAVLLDSTVEDAQRAVSHQIKNIHATLSDHIKQHNRFVDILVDEGVPLAEDFHKVDMDNLVTVRSKGINKITGDIKFKNKLLFQLWKRSPIGPLNNTKTQIHLDLLNNLTKPQTKEQRRMQNKRKQLSTNHNNIKDGSLAS